MRNEEYVRTLIRDTQRKVDKSEQLLAKLEQSEIDTRRFLSELKGELAGLKAELAEIKAAPQD